MVLFGKHQISAACDSNISGEEASSAYPHRNSHMSYLNFTNAKILCGFHLGVIDPSILAVIPKNFS